MKRYILSLFLVFTIGAAYAQDFVFETADTVITNGSASDFEIVGYGTIRNLTSSPINLRWLRTQNSLPQGWQAAICDNITCHAPEADSNDFILPANGTAPIDLHFYPNNSVGSGNAVVRVFRPSDRGNAIQTRYVGNVYSTSTQNIAKGSLNIYPNPASSEINIKLPEFRDGKIEVFNVIGKRLLTQNFNGLTNTVQVSLTNLPKGTYVLRYSNNSGTIITKTFQKS
jgi:hypothetical protein